MRTTIGTMALALALACGGSSESTGTGEGEEVEAASDEGGEVPPDQELGPDGRDAARGCGDATSPECEDDPTECQGNEVLTLGENDPTPGAPGCRCVPLCDTLNPGPPG